MRKVQLPQEILSYINSGVCGTFVFINDFDGWGDEAKNIPGINIIPAMEGNGLQSKETGEPWLPQCCTLRRGNHLKAQLRNATTNEVKEVKLGELPLFNNFPVVIMTSGEALHAFAPVCSNKLELALFIASVKEESEKRNAAHEDEYDYSWSCIAREMISLAKFLYKSNPEKTSSPLDDLD